MEFGVFVEAGAVPWRGAVSPFLRGAVDAMPTMSAAAAALARRYLTIFVCSVCRTRPRRRGATTAEAGPCYRTSHRSPLAVSADRVRRSRGGCSWRARGRGFPRRTRLNTWYRPRTALAISGRVSAAARGLSVPRDSPDSRRPPRRIRASDARHESGPSRGAGDVSSGSPSTERTTARPVVHAQFTSSPHGLDVASLGLFAACNPITLLPRRFQTVNGRPRKSPHQARDLPHVCTARSPERITRGDVAGAKRACGRGAWLLPRHLMCHQPRSIARLRLVVVGLADVCPTRPFSVRLPHDG